MVVHQYHQIPCFCWMTIQKSRHWRSLGSHDNPTSCWTIADHQRSGGGTSQERSTGGRRKKAPAGGLLLAEHGRHWNPGFLEGIIQNGQVGEVLEFIQRGLGNPQMAMVLVGLRIDQVVQGGFWGLKLIFVALKYSWFRIIRSELTFNMGVSYRLGSPKHPKTIGNLHIYNYIIWYYIYIYTL